MTKLIRLLFISALAIFFTSPASAQPTYHDSYSDRFISVGFQPLFQNEIGRFNTFSVNTEVLYSFVGSKANILAGKDYLSFSPFGLLLFIPNILFDSYNSLADPSEGAFLMLLAMSSLQFHIPLTDYLEVTTGWDALKFTRFKAWDNTLYIQGSLNAGLNYFTSDNFYINVAYEFTHPHNPLIACINWLFCPPDGDPIGYQPTWLMGHSAIIRVGYMF